MELKEVYIVVFLMSWLWSKFDPLQELIEIAWDELPENLITKSAFSLLTCWYCLTLWMGAFVIGFKLEVVGGSFAAWFIEGLTQRSR